VGQLTRFLVFLAPDKSAIQTQKKAHPMLGQFLSTFINVVTPVFGLVLIGYLVGPRLNLEARTLSRTSYFILVPAFIFNIISQADVEVSLAARMVFYIILVHLACALLGLTIARLLGRPPELVGAYVLVAIFGNVANFGLSMIEFKLGEAALAPGALYFLTINITAFTVSVMAANWARGGKMAAVSSVFKTPAVLAFIPAVFFWTTQLELPLFVTRIIGLLSDAAIPVMLVTLGVQLTEIGTPKPNLDVLLASAVRLLGGPLLAVLLAIPFGITGLARSTGILQSGMPPAVLTAIIAMEHDLAPKFVTTTLLVATLASLITLTVVLLFV
jgi:predicted permease